MERTQQQRSNFALQMHKHGCNTVPRNAWTKFPHSIHCHCPHIRLTRWMQLYWGSEAMSEPTRGDGTTSGWDSASDISIPLGLSSRSFIPRPRFVRSRHSIPLLTPCLVLFPPHSAFLLAFASSPAAVIFEYIRRQKIQNSCFFLPVALGFREYSRRSPVPRFRTPRSAYFSILVTLSKDIMHLFRIAGKRWKRSTQMSGSPPPLTSILQTPNVIGSLACLPRDAWWPAP